MVSIQNEYDIINFNKPQMVSFVSICGWVISIDLFILFFLH